MRLRMAPVTARSAPAHERAIRTLMDWQIEVDEAYVLRAASPKAISARVRARLLVLTDEVMRNGCSAPSRVPAGAWSGAAGCHHATRVTKISPR